MRFKQLNIEINHLFWIEPLDSKGISFKQGDLGYTYENTTDIFYKDTEGNMIVVSDDSGNYEIDDEGQLVFTE